MSRSDNRDPLPESGMGGASDSGAHGKHPASAAKLENRSPLPMMFREMRPSNGGTTVTRTIAGPNAESLD